MLFLVYALAGIFVAFAGMQFLVVLRSKKNKGRRIEQVNGKIGKMMTNGEETMVYFYSPGCRACKYQTPIIDRLISLGHKIQKVDISRDISIARKFGVMATPTTVVLKGNEIVEFMVGAKTEEKLTKYLN
jgi:thioredoxin 1